MKIQKGLRVGFLVGLVSGAITLVLKILPAMINNGSSSGTSFLDIISAVFILIPFLIGMFFVNTINIFLTYQKIPSCGVIHYGSASDCTIQLVLGHIIILIISSAIGYLIYKIYKAKWKVPLLCTHL